MYTSMQAVIMLLYMLVQISCQADHLVDEIKSKSQYSQDHLRLCKSLRADVVLMLDTVLSPSQMSHVIASSVEFINNFNADTGLLTTSLVTFSDRAEVVFQHETGSQDSMIRKIYEISPVDYSSDMRRDTVMVDALKLMVDLAKTSEDKNGNSSVKIAVMLTAFVPVDNRELEMFRTAYSMGINVFVFVIRNMYYAELTFFMAKYSYLMVYLNGVNNHEDLVPFVAYLMSGYCPRDLPKRPLCHTQAVDLLLLLDLPSSLPNTELHDIVSGLEDIVKHFDTDNGFLRTTLIMNSGEANIIIFLGDHEMERDLIRALRRIEEPAASTTQTGVNVTSLLDEVLLEANGHRRNVSTMAVIVTYDGTSVSDVLTRLAEDSVRSYVLVVGGNTTMESYKNATEPMLVFTEESKLMNGFQKLVFTEESKLMNGFEKLVNEMCPACDETQGWYFHRDKCYMSVKVPVYGDLSWFDAKHLCSLEGAVLSTIRNHEDEQFIRSITPYIGLYPDIYIGLSTDYSRGPGIFKDTFTWQDGTPLIYTNWKYDDFTAEVQSLKRCVFNRLFDGWRYDWCGNHRVITYSCMKPKHGMRLPVSESPPTLPTNITWTFNQDAFTVCRNEEVVLMVKVCDGMQDCRDGSDELDCETSCASHQHQCNNGACVSFTLVCDGVNDCGDNTDEECYVEDCSEDEWRCDSGQCVTDDKRCDMLLDCLDGSDEDNCEVCNNFACQDGACIPITWVNDGDGDCIVSYEDELNLITNTVTYDHLVKKANTDISPVRSLPPTSDWFVDDDNCYRIPDMFGKSKRVKITSEVSCSHVTCSEGFYKCSDSYCIPVFTVCNGVKDCPNGEDEVRCDVFTCPGYYKCEGVTQCVHPSQICDGLRHCPKGDDERVCLQTCPDDCQCHGRVITCQHAPDNVTMMFPDDARKLNLSGIDLQSTSLNISSLVHLFSLTMSYCNVHNISGLFNNLMNLDVLDLSFNRMTVITSTSFIDLTRLNKMDLSNNYELNYIEKETFRTLGRLQELDLSKTNLISLSENYFAGLSNLIILNLTDSSLEAIEEKTFSGLYKLHFLGISHNRIERFERDIFDDLNSLQEMHTDSYKLCCSSVRPISLNFHNCKSSQSKISSCTDLIGEGFLRILLWIIGTCATIGNISVIVYRIKFDTKSLKRSYGIFVLNMSVADCLMGVYMLIVGTADLVYRGSYIWNDYSWRNSSTCEVAGFLSTLASEASCIFITLITADRLLAIKFPFGQIRFTKSSTAIFSVITWLVSLVLAGIPLLPPFRSWGLYSKNSMCLALPLSSQRTPGWQYSSGIFIGLNFALFLLIGVCQVLIYQAVSSAAKFRAAVSSDQKVARSLFLVVFTDFLCWFPIGVMGILALQGVHIDGVVYAWTAVLVLPVNSALNPILYTLPSVLRAKNKSKSHKETEMETEYSTTSTKYPMSRKDASKSSPTNLPLKEAEFLVGNPTRDMMSLREFLQTDVADSLKCDVIVRFVESIHTLLVAGRHFQPISEENLFVGCNEKTVSKLCISLENNPGRQSSSRDILYLLSLWRNTGLSSCTSSMDVSENTV